MEITREKLNHASEDEAKQLLDEVLGDQIQSGAPLPSGKGGTMPKQAETGKQIQSSGSLPQFSPQARQNAMLNAQDVVSEEGNRIQLAKTSTILDSNNPGITYNHQYLGSGYEKSASDLVPYLKQSGIGKSRGTIPAGNDKGAAEGSK